jgi:type VI secretion system secreted protein Hcp
MAIDSIVQFVPYRGNPLDSESQTDYSSISNDNLGKGVFTAGKIFEVSDYSFEIEQTLSIGSHSTGAGAGKISFAPFSITRVIDRASPLFFQMSCSGEPFKFVHLALRKAGGGAQQTGVIYLRYDFKLVAVKTISYSYDDEAPKETITFEYGGLQIRYRQQKADGTFEAAIPAGWNRVTNVADVSSNAIPA